MRLILDASVADRPVKQRFGLEINRRLLLILFRPFRSHPREPIAASRRWTRRQSTVCSGQPLPAPAVARGLSTSDMQIVGMHGSVERKCGSPDTSVIASGEKVSLNPAEFAVDKRSQITVMVHMPSLDGIWDLNSAPCVKHKESGLLRRC